jgi:hypothetical protein
LGNPTGIRTPGDRLGEVVVLFGNPGGAARNAAACLRTGKPYVLLSVLCPVPMMNVPTTYYVAERRADSVRRIAICRTATRRALIKIN